MLNVDEKTVDLLMIKDLAQKILSEIEAFEDSQRIAQAPLISIGPSGIGGYCQDERTVTEQVNDGMAVEMCEEGLGRKTKKVIEEMERVKNG